MFAFEAVSDALRRPHRAAEPHDQFVDRNCQWLGDGELAVFAHGVLEVDVHNI